MSDRRKPGDETAPDARQSAPSLCPKCSGSGKVSGKPCPDCKGTGTVSAIVGDA